MKAGAEVVDRIDSDFAEMARDSSIRPLIRYGSNTLSLAFDGALRRLLLEAAKILAEPQSVLTAEASEADIEGHLSDLVQLLDDHAE